MQIIQEIYNGRFASNKGKGPVFATTWINMQDAYFQEKADVGDWVQIGYSAPGQKGANASSYASNVFTYTSTGANWKAVPKQKLNDCEGTSEFWALNATKVDDGKFTIGDGGTATDCKALTASWDNLMRSAD